MSIPRSQSCSLRNSRRKPACNNSGAAAAAFSPSSVRQASTTRLSEAERSRRTSSWMSLHVMAMGVALAAYANWIALISVTYALTYAFLAIYWHDTSEHPVFSQAVLVWTSCAFAWIMSVTFSMRARRRFYLTELYEKARIAAEKAQEFSTFLLAATGHDIRQPVYALDLNASLLEDLLEAENWEKAKEVAGRQREVVRNVSSLLSSVLELSYLDTDRRPVDRERVAIGDLVREVVTPLEEVGRSKGIEVRWIGSSQTIEIDRGIVEHILTNLVSNAITHSGGKRVLIGAIRNAGGIDLLVVDDGNGIGREVMMLDSMLMVEESRKTGHRRAGLGLEIIFRLAEKGRMRMQIHSRPGHGTLARLGQGLT